MKMQTADEIFDYSVWFVLDKIREAMLPDNSVISYFLDINVKRLSPISFQNERKAIKYLLSSGVIREIGEPVIIEGGTKGTINYSVIENYKYKIIRKRFTKFYEHFYLKVFSKKHNNKVKKLVKEKLKELIKVRKIGKKQTKLLFLLADHKPVYRSVIESKTKSKNLTALIRDTRKSIKGSIFGIELIRSNTISKENSYKLVINSYY